MKIVVTGALGHIGSRLVRELPKAFGDAEILMLDNLLTQRYCSLFELPVEGRYRFVEADVLNADLAPIFSGADVVVHLAAITDAASSFERRDEVEQVNLAGTRRVADACRDAACPVIFPSTTSVYGPQGDVVDENCDADDLRPQSPYADSKLKAEEYLQALGSSDGLHSVICRFGTIFGTSRGMRFHTAINKFCWQAAMGEKLTVWRTALHQCRPYLDLSDATDAIGFIISEELYDGRVYNVLTANMTVSEIIDRISCIVPDVSVEYVDSEIMNQLSYTVSSKRFRDTGFEFHGSLEQGIADTIDLLRAARTSHSGASGE